MATLGQFPLSHSRANAVSLAKPPATGQKPPGTGQHPAELAGQGRRVNDQCPMTR